MGETRISKLYILYTIKMIHIELKVPQLLTGDGVWMICGLTLCREK
jgi:hypothetical protein